MNYFEAKALFDTARNLMRGKPLPGREGRTRLMQRDNAYAVKYTHTDVLTIHPDNSVTLNTDGWNSKTTRERINTYAEQVQIFTVDNHQYVTETNKHPWNGSAKRIWEFRDGMIFNSKGTKCLNAVQLGIREFTNSQWHEHVRKLRNEKAKERRERNKRRAIEDAARAARREELNRVDAKIQKMAKTIVTTPPIQNTGLVWPTLLRRSL